ncbi:MAG: AMP-binding protein [Bacteroidaceae bacterium]
MEEIGSLIKLIEQSIIENWSDDAMSDYQGITLQYNDVARKIEKCHILFKQCGIQPGDKIALCGRNSVAWGVVFLASITYRAVVVPILHEFKADNIHTIINHSEARFLFVGDRVWENLNEDDMPNLEGILHLTNFEPIIDRTGKLTQTFNHLNELFGKKFPCKFRKENVNYIKEDAPNQLALINYTSGTTGYSKGVMLPYRSLVSNLYYCKRMIRLKPGDHMISILPLGHVFGMTYDLLYGLSTGTHIHFLTRIPSPKVIMQSFSEIKPRVISTVPLIVEKTIKKSVLPQLNNPLGRLLLKLPIISDVIKTRAREVAIKAFGGEFDEIIIGGAPFNREIEAFLKQIEFPYAVGYGMTECGPIICHARWEDIKLYSCGRAADHMEVKITSPDPENIPGEIICRGANVMLGYYKNQEATNQIIDRDGWLHTGDLATMDKEGNVTIKGRSKNLLLTSSGQNIYPEEIESKLNNMPYVGESLIVLQNERLVALIYPEFDEAYANGLLQQDIELIMEQNRVTLNDSLPKFSQIAKVKIYPEEFEKTAKRSIKRFLYQEAKG